MPQSCASCLFRPACNDGEPAGDGDPCSEPLLRRPGTAIWWEGLVEKGFDLSGQQLRLGLCPGGDETGDLIFVAVVSLQVETVIDKHERLVLLRVPDDGAAGNGTLPRDRIRPRQQISVDVLLPVNEHGITLGCETDTYMAVPCATDRKGSSEENYRIVLSLDATDRHCGQHIERGEYARVVEHGQ